MTKKRRQENLEYLLSIEQEMTSQGKRLSPAFYAQFYNLLAYMRFLLYFCSGKCKR